MLTTPIRKKEEIELLKEYFLCAHEYRNYALFVMGINTALRISDILNLKWKDVYNFQKDEYHPHVFISEKKTKKTTYIALNKNCIEALDLLRNTSKPQTDMEFIFYSRNHRDRRISRNRAYCIIKQAATQLQLDGNISCHSLRKTFGYHAWKYGAPPALIMNVYNHSNIETTKRYLSIEQDEKDELFLNMNL